MRLAYSVLSPQFSRLLDLYIAANIADLENLDSDSALHLHHRRIRTERVNATNDRQCLRLEIWRKHVLVQVDFFFRQSTKCFVLDERKANCVPYTRHASYPHQTRGAIHYWAYDWRASDTGRTTSVRRRRLFTKHVARSTAARRS